MVHFLVLSYQTYVYKLTNQGIRNLTYSSIILISHGQTIYSLFTVLLLSGIPSAINLACTKKAAIQDSITKGARPESQKGGIMC